MIQGFGSREFATQRNSQQLSQGYVLKITFVLPYFGMSGGIRVAAIYADLLQRRGHDVLIVSQPAKEPTSSDRIRSLLRGKKAKKPKPAGSYLKNKDVKHIVLDRRRPVLDSDVPDADCIIASWWETAYWVSALSESKGAKFHFVQGHEVFAPIPWQISRGAYFLPFRRIAVSQWLIDILAREYGDTNATLIHNSVDLDQFHATPRDRQPTPTVGFVYSKISTKGIDICLRAIEQARRHIPDLKLIAFGSRAPADDLIEGSTFFENPAQDDIRNIYASCDAWLFGSRGEGFGLPLLEAMACRTPVIATRAGAAPDLIKNGVNGHVVDIEDSDAMAARIVDVLKLPPAEWREMSDAALEVAKGHTWEDATDRFEKTLLEATR